MKYFAGIGSRETPPHILESMKAISKAFTELGYTLRSGGAKGADSAFQEGAFGSNQEIFLSKHATNRSMELAMNFHPNPKALKKQGNYICSLMGRNMMIISGKDLETHVDFVVTWTKDGKNTGGSGQAMRYAESLNIPIYNLYYDKAFDELEKLYGKIVVDDYLHKMRCCEL